MCTQPTRANKHQEINLKTLGDDKLKWKKMQQAVEKEWNTWCKCDAATHISGPAVEKVRPRNAHGPPLCPAPGKSPRSREGRQWGHKWSPVVVDPAFAAPLPPDSKLILGLAEA